MVSHVLIDKASRYVNSFVLWHLHQDVTEALKSLVETVKPMVHQTKMKSRSNEVITDRNCLLEHLDCLLL